MREYFCFLFLLIMKHKSTPQALAIAFVCCFVTFFNNLNILSNF